MPHASRSDEGAWLAGDFLDVAAVHDQGPEQRCVEPDEEYAPDWAVRHCDEAGDQHDKRHDDSDDTAPRLAGENRAAGRHQEDADAEVDSTPGACTKVDDRFGVALDAAEEQLPATVESDDEPGRDHEHGCGQAQG